MRRGWAVRESRSMLGEAGGSLDGTTEVAPIVRRSSPSDRARFRTAYGDKSARHLFLGVHPVPVRGDFALRFG
jgi:hypothetical protein